MIFPHASKPGVSARFWYVDHGRRLSARQKLTRETLVFFGNFTRQNGVVEHQLDIGFQAVTAGQLSNARQQERCTFFTNNALLFGFGDGLDLWLH